MMVSIPSLALGVLIGLLAGLGFWALLGVGVIWRLVKSVKVAEIRTYRGGLKGIESLKAATKKK